MRINKNKIGINVITMSIMVSGLISLTTGTVLNKIEIKPNNKVKVTVVQKQVAKQKSNIPVLREVTTEVNVPISVNVSDYIENLDDIDANVLSKFKLDTSLVNLTEKGNYTYTVTYKEKKYNGIVTVKEKELPVISTMTLKEISLAIGTKLPTSISDYITETIPEEAKDKIVINTKSVDINKAATYQYTITYNDKMYTGNIIIYEPQPVVITPIINNKEENTTTEEENKETTVTTDTNKEDTTIPETTDKNKEEEKTSN